MVSPLITHSLLLSLGVVVLYFGAEWLVRGASRMAAALGVPPIVVGLTVVAMGTSAPELVVCLVAVLGGNSDLVMGNVLGSNLANVGLILGVTAMIWPLDVASRVVSRELPVMVVVTLLLFPLAWDGAIGRPDGIILVVVLALYLLSVNRTAIREPTEVAIEFDGLDDEAAPGPARVAKSVGLVVAGSIGLVLGGRAVVLSAEYFAVAFGVPDLIIGLTLVAIGTSLPELATALVAAVRKEADIAVGNIVGSNIFNIAAILGITSIVAPVEVAPSILFRELPAVLVVSLVTVAIARTAHRVHRWEGALLLATYVGVGFWLIR